MHPEEYFAAVRLCPDDRLAEEHGILDNFTILIQGDVFDQVTSDLEKSVETDEDFSIRYSLSNTWKYGDWDVYNLLKPGDVRNTYAEENRLVDLCAVNRPTIILPFDEEAPIWALAQGWWETYTISMVFHPNMKDKETHYLVKHRRMAEVVEDICTYLTKHSIPFLLHDSRGSEHEELERIVQWDPAEAVV